MRITRRVLSMPDALPEMLELAGGVWRQDPARLNFETSFGTIAWEGGGVGRIRAFDRNGSLAGWARLVPGYDDLDGYRFVTMAELDDVDARAEVHRRAWDGSSRSADDVERTMSTWPYKPRLDFIAVADDGTPAASVIGWYDDAFGYGEFEPMGTFPEHRGRGLGAALLRFGMRQLHLAGARHAVVGARADADYPVPRRLYRSVGFVDTAIQVVHRQP